MVFSQIFKSCRSSFSKNQEELIEELFVDELDFEDINFPVKIKKIKKNNYIDISAFGYERKEKYL